MKNQSRCIIYRCTDYFLYTLKVVSKVVSKNEKTSPQMPVMRFLSDSVGIRTQDPQLRRLLLYPAELPDQTFIVNICGNVSLGAMPLGVAIPLTLFHKIFLFSKFLQR